MSEQLATPQHLLITPQSTWWRIPVVEWWQYRHILITLVRRDLQVRYKQTVIGLSWVVVQPLIEMSIFTLIFSKHVHLAPEGVPYPLFVFIGILAWGYFSSAVSGGTQSIVAGSGLLQRLYFPRILLPLARTLSRLVDVAISFVLLVGLLLYYNVPLHLEALWAFPLFGLLYLLVTGISFWTSSLHTLYRDVGLMVPYCLRLGIFVSPVIYPSHVLGQWQWVFTLNPLTGIVESLRTVLLGYGSLPTQALLLSTGISVVVFLTGILFFQRMEEHFVDVL